MRIVLCSLFVLLLVVVDSFGSLYIKSPSRSKLQPIFSSKYSKSAKFKTLRGGYTDCLTFANGALEKLVGSPALVYNAYLLGLSCGVIVWRAAESNKQSTTSVKEGKPIGVTSLQKRFLIVFWFIRMADWLQGPYFFEVYSSKVYGGSLAPAAELVSKIFLAGFVTTGAFGPLLGRLVDVWGRKKGTLAFTALYTFSALSTRTNNLGLILLGRVAGGLGTSLLFSAPEAWLVTEHNRGKFDGKWLGETFGWAFAGDALVAILAGQLASFAARRVGPTGPFMLSIAFLLAGAGVIVSQWGENVATTTVTTAPPTQEKTQKSLWDITNPKPSKGTDSNKPTTAPLESKNARKDQIAIRMMLADPKILLVGAVQALFEGAMYIFVLQWAPLLKTAIQSSHFGDTTDIPYGNIFSCFMASCLLGSTVFSSLQRRGTKVEKSASYMLMTATAALTTASLLGPDQLLPLSAAFFLFEACVGMYFPSIGTLRSKYLPDRHRSVLMNLFGIPLNLIVVSVFLSLKSLGSQGALHIASGALGLATICMTVLHNLSERDSLKVT